MSEDEVLTKLKAKRRIIKASITRQQTAANNFKESDDPASFETRIGDLNSLFKTYNEIQSEIEIIQYSKLESTTSSESNEITALEEEINKERTEVENQYYRILTQIRSIVSKNGRNAKEPTSEAQQSQTIININGNPDRFENSNNLKPLPLPTFSGKHSNWYTFYESFKALVHDDNTLSDIKKFHYLRGCLRDDALRAIESLSVSSQNYNGALDLLLKRYDNKRLVVQEHISNILHTPQMTKSCHNELRQLLDVLNNNITSLEALKLSVKQWDALLISIVCEKLDYHTKKEWQTKLDKELPTYKEFTNFLEKRCQLLEALTTVKSTNVNSKSNSSNKASISNQNIKKFNKFATNVVSKGTCVFCKKTHASFQCEKFLNLSVTDRLKQVESLNLCSNCLRANHSTDQCKVTATCKSCQQKHHTLLHINEFVQSTSTLLIKSPNQVLLSTAEVLIADNLGNFHNCRVLLDQCSEANIITTSLCKKLNLITNKITSTILGVNTNESPVSEMARVVIKSRISDFASSLNCFVLNNITKPTPALTFEKSLIKVPENTILADPNFNISQNVDLLIGVQLFWKLLIEGPVQLHKNQPYLQNTHLGWILGGDLYIPNSMLNPACNVIVHDNLPTNSELVKFWTSEVETESQWTAEQLAFEQHFIKNSYRDSQGKFVVKLPVKNEMNLGDSLTLATKQFHTLERRFQRDPQLKSAYKEFMTEYFELGHMERVPSNELKNSQNYYLPHHAVFKRTPTGPKIRVVFNASAKSTNNLSLNDNLMTGPTIQEDLFSILCRFRTFQYALSADITKMYRMVLINSSDRDFQRILWRENPNKPIETFRLKTVTYGTTCAPFLAVRCLFQLALESQNKFPLASKIIKRDFYMDDLLTGSDSLEEAIKLRNTVTNILASGGFNLCKWASNSRAILPNEPFHNQSVNFDKNEDIKVLGFHWSCQSDELKYNVDLANINNTSTITKRKILSTVAKIFDPIGLIEPVIIKIKILIQNLWTLKLNWDDQVPPEIEKTWHKLLNNLKELNDYRIPRKLIPTHPNLTMELHGFADASSKAYGAVIYLKTVDTTNEVSINLLCSKSRVVPLKPVTLPRLELNAAVLLTKLMNKVIKILNLKINQVYYWTDSTIVLCWLSEPSDHWKQYVANRTKQIQSISSREQWYHVRSADNPADIVSRGMTSQQLHHCDLWWHGPEWLQKNQNKWPSLSLAKTSEVDSASVLERKSSVAVNLIQVDPELPVITKFSSFTKLQRVIAYCLRFIKTLKARLKKAPIKNNTNTLSVEEMNQALITILRHIQLRAFLQEFNQIGQTNKSSKLSKLDPFIDHNGLLRVGGRLKNAPINYDHKFPIILPEKHFITKLLIKQVHERELHAGNEATLAAVRQQFWPLSGRNLVRKLIHSCVKCTRANPKSSITKMGNLPKLRVQPIRPFFNSGVDYAGPFLIKNGTTRNASKMKAYIALFVCFSTKAVHLELVGNLTTESFLAALNRFTSRRGNVSEIYCDNGTNFVGAERELIRSETFQNKIIDHFSTKNTKFNFIPANSPHFGGLWERAVRSVKHHLHRVVGDASLTYEEFYTLLTRVEACLNSRPLTPLSQDPNDLEALTPGHFLIGAAITSPIEPDLREIQINRLSRWQRIQQLYQHFWTRWQREYLQQLQTRPRGQQAAQANITVGTLVVLVEENLPPLKWRLGRVIDVHPGSDGVVRVVTVKTASGTYKRAIRKVCVIPNE